MLKPFVFPVRTDAYSTATSSGENGVDGSRDGSANHYRYLGAALIRIGLVDSFDFTRDCIAKVLMRRRFSFSVSEFTTIDGLIGKGINNFNLLLYYDHGARPSSLISVANDLAMREEIADVPVIVLTDATAALDPETARAALGRRVRGFISTRSSDIRTVSSALRSVVAGDVFVSADLLARQEVTSAATPLTRREITVLSLLQEGKANREIACALSMSENTTKVHIRNIMRKMGAINRTQAIYKFQRLGLDKAS